MPKAKPENLPVLIIGAGGHARVLIETLRLCGRSILGVVDPALPKGHSAMLGLAVLGGDEVLDDCRPDETALVNGVGSVKPGPLRDAIYRRGLARGFRFASIIHPSAVVSWSAKVAEGTQVMAGCVIQCDASVGANSIINTRCSIDHDCRIGETVHVAPGATLSGAVTVGDGTHIGTGAVVIQGITIGRNSLIAAGAVVYHDLPDEARLVTGR